MDWSFETMGTVVQIKIWDKVSPILLEKTKLDILNFSYWYDETFSRFKHDSLITKISKKPGTYTVPKELTEMLKIYFELNLVTNGSVNPLIGNTISDLGYDALYTLRKKDIVTKTPTLNETIKIVDEETIEIKEAVLIDIGALGKGFWVDEVVKILVRNSFQKFFVNGSGDIYYKTNDDEKLRVGLEDPFDSNTMLGYVEIHNEAICGSGINRRNWSIQREDNLHHVVDANTSRPTDSVLSTWVKASNTTLSDGLATALFFTNPEVLKNAFTFEYLVIDINKKTLVSESFRAVII